MNKLPYVRASILMISLYSCIYLCIREGKAEPGKVRVQRVYWRAKFHEALGKVAQGTVVG